MGFPALAGPLVRAGLWRRSWPFVLAGLITIATLGLRRGDVTDGAALYAAAATAAALVAIALLVPWHRLPHWPQSAVPIGFLGVVALLRESTGGTPGFAVLVMLPVLWLALYGTRTELTIAIGMTALVFLVPILAVGGPAYSVSDVGRIVLWPVTAAIVGATTYRLVAAERERSAFVSGILSAATQQAIVATDPAGTITAFNTGAERMTGYRAPEMIGSARLSDLHDREELARRAAAIGAASDADLLTAAARRGLPDTREWTYLTKDRRRIQVELSVSPIHDANGALQGFISVGTDVTERRAAERLKDEFVALVSHELRTPLSSIIGYVELLSDEDDSGALSTRQRHFLDVIDRNARRQLRLVSDLLFVSQVDAGRVRLDLTDVDLDAVARAAVDAARPRAKAAGVVLELHTSEQVRVRGDGDRLGQVFDNLITNAVKFTPPAGRVGVRLSRTAESVRIEVSDTGIGIPAAEQERLFSRFFRASTATSRAIPGIGLGLTIVKAIVEEHGGTIGQSSVVGEGTTFRIELPAGR